MNAYDDERTEYDIAMDILSEKVDHGEVFLDSVDPEWYKKVNLPQLHMSNGMQCICGWVFKAMMNDGYSYFIREYDPNEELGRHYGFMPYHEEDMPDSIDTQQWSMLAELWTVKVEKRLAQDGLLS